jgi:hypothetical protein
VEELKFGNDPEVPEGTEEGNSEIEIVVDGIAVVDVLGVQVVTVVDSDEVVDEVLLDEMVVDDVLVDEVVVIAMDEVVVEMEIVGLVVWCSVGLSRLRTSDGPT